MALNVSVPSLVVVVVVRRFNALLSCRAGIRGTLICRKRAVEQGCVSGLCSAAVLTKDVVI